MKSQGTEELGCEDLTYRRNVAGKSHRPGHLGVCDKLCGPTGLQGTGPGVRVSRGEGRHSSTGSRLSHVKEFRLFLDSQ